MIENVKLLKKHKAGEDKGGFVYGLSLLVDNEYQFMKPIKKLMFMKTAIFNEEKDFYLKRFNKGRVVTARLQNNKVVFMCRKTESFIKDKNIQGNEVKDKMGLKNIQSDRQKMIVKQSCLTRAIEILEYNEVQEMDTEQVKKMAEDLTEWVME